MGEARAGPAPAHSILVAVRHDGAPAADRQAGPRGRRAQPGERERRGAGRAPLAPLDARLTPPPPPRPQGSSARAFAAQVGPRTRPRRPRARSAHVPRAHPPRSAPARSPRRTTPTTRSSPRRPTALTSRCARLEGPASLPPLAGGGAAARPRRGRRRGSATRSAALPAPAARRRRLAPRRRRRPPPRDETRTAPEPPDPHPEPPPTLHPPPPQWPRTLNASLEEVDPELFDIIEHEKGRQYRGLELIPSENFVSRSVMEAVGSVMTNKVRGRRWGWRILNGFGNCLVELASSPRRGGGAASLSLAV